MWFISLLTVWFGLLQVCCKFIASLLQVCCKFVAKFEYSNSNKRPIQQKPYHTRFGFIGWLIDRIYNKQQYNDQSVNCCKQPTPTPTQTKTPTISYPYPYLIIAYSIQHIACSIQHVAHTFAHICNPYSTQKKGKWTPNI